ncbi:hypothetical protein AJ79_07992 [Helicocarpus griseus UAMH5409]|uniref:TauD/TfdA-like domain-containing protein n=1 Tax=Helicocarpus griseus UAMH5409 TaxID=1447875 RepID=A0A2B7WXH8_9EURO|nr:hypothetical protein AJ79_07992 [Helicocarpus griseus UAMH5409]
MTTSKAITVQKLHPTFGAEVRGVDFSNISDEIFSEILAVMAVHGVCVFRSSGLDDLSHVEFSKRMGELDDVKRYMTQGRKPRLPYFELFDAGNVDDKGNAVAPDSARAHFGKGNALWHVDSSFNPRRASFSLLRAVQLPPPNNGGNTDFADSRRAFDDLPENLKQELLENNYVGAHTIAQSRKLGSPEYFKDLDPSKEKMARHYLVQKHEPSGRMNLYIAAHCHHIEGVSADKSQELIDTLMKHATQEKYTLSVEWQNPTDLIIWDNRCVLHRANGGTFEGRYVRDLRRTTVHDDGPMAWGLNNSTSDREDYVSKANLAAATNSS